MKIRNKTTGEIMEINPEEAPKYGLNPNLAPSTETWKGGWLEPPTGVSSVGEYFKPIPTRAGKEVVDIAKGLGGLALEGATFMPKQGIDVAQTIAAIAQGKGKERFAQKEKEAEEKRKILGPVLKGAVTDVYRSFRYPVKSFYHRPVGTASDWAIAATLAKKGVTKVADIAQAQKRANQLSANLITAAAQDPKQFEAMVNEMARTKTTAGATTIPKGSEFELALRKAKGLSPAEQANVIKQTKPAMKFREDIYKTVMNLKPNQVKEYNPDMVLRKLGQRYQIAGSWDDMANVSDDVIREVNDITTNAVKAMPEVDTSGVAQLIKEVRPQLNFLDKKDIDAVTSILHRSNLVSQKQIGGALDLGAGLDITTSPPKNVLDVLRTFERQGHKYAMAALKTGDQRTDQLSKLYKLVGRALEASLETQLDDVALEGLKTPEKMARLEAIHPNLALDVAKATTIRDMRKVLEPFAKMLRIKEASEANTAVDVARQAGMAGAGAGSGALQMLGLPTMGGRYGLAGALGRLFMGPVTEKVMQAAMKRVPAYVTKIATSTPKVNIGTPGKIAGEIGKTTALIPALETTAAYIRRLGKSKK